MIFVGDLHSHQGMGLSSMSRLPSIVLIFYFSSKSVSASVGNHQDPSVLCFLFEFFCDSFLLFTCFQLPQCFPPSCISALAPSTLTCSSLSSPGVCHRLSLVFLESWCHFITTSLCFSCLSLLDLSELFFFFFPPLHIFFCHVNLSFFFFFMFNG